MTISITKSVVGGSENTWGSTTNQALDDIVDVLNGNTASTPDLTAGSWKVGGTAVTSSAAEINKLDGFTGDAADLNYAKDLRATGVTTTEFDKLDGLTASTTDLNILSGAAAAGVTSTEVGYLDGVTSNIQTQLNNISGVPAGAIILWSGSTASIPSGWVLCNGSNSTPDLRDRFVVGAGSTYAVDATGGASSVTLSTSQIPAHNHSASSSTTISDSGHSHSIPALIGTETGSGGTTSTVSQGTSVAASTNSATTGITASTSTSIGNTGGGGSHENRPPYYALAYIMKT